MTQGTDILTSAPFNPRTLNVVFFPHEACQSGATEHKGRPEWGCGEGDVCLLQDTTGPFACPCVARSTFVFHRLSLFALQFIRIGCNISSLSWLFIKVTCIQQIKQFRIV